MFNTVQKLDTVSLVILCSGILFALVCLILGQGFVSVFLVLCMSVIMLVRRKKEQQEYNRRYGYLYYVMSDQEIVQESISVLWDQEKRFEGRNVSVRFQYQGRDGNFLDTGLGIWIDVSTAQMTARLERHQEICVTGTLHKREEAWVIDQVTRFEVLQS